VGAHRREASTEILAKPVRLLPHRGGIIPILRMGGGEIGIDLLVQAIVSRVQGTTPIGKSFARLDSAQGQVVSKSDQDLVSVCGCPRLPVPIHPFSTLHILLLPRATRGPWYRAGCARHCCDGRGPRHHGRRRDGRGRKRSYPKRYECKERNAADRRYTNNTGSAIPACAGRAPNEPSRPSEPRQPRRRGIRVSRGSIKGSQVLHGTGGGASGGRPQAVSTRVAPPPPGLVLNPTRPTHQR
jgi:hypothetical protein